LGSFSHGAGRKHQTLSDLVYKIEYVDAHGQYRTIDRNEGDFLSAASGCFGLIGVITHLTLEFDPMTYAEMRPRKVDVIDAIPPPPHMRADIPKALYKPRTDEQIRKSQEDFETRASEHYYAEWFWFPYADQVWINTWQTTTDSSHVEHYPDKKKIVQQWLEAVAMEAMQNLALNKWTKYITPSLRTTTVCKSN
jgi:D-arabinono-1,4-lactone oxidase